MDEDYDLDDVCWFWYCYGYYWQVYYGNRSNRY